jgi:outer membrane receptor for ferrienterochelin and colicin
MKKTKRYFYLLFFIISIHSFSYGQIFSELRGMVKDKNGLPVFTATAVLQNSGLGAVTDENGGFVIKNVAPGSYNVTVSFLGYRSQTQFNVIVKSVGNQPLNFVLIENADSLDEITVYSEINQLAKPKETPLSSQTLSSTEIETYPGGNNDVVKVVQSLPGVSPSIGGFRNDLIIRGGAPNETVYFLDGVEIPNINHFSTQGSSGGPVGMLNVSFIDNVTLSSSAFNSKYDNALSGVMQFKQKSGNKRKLNGIFRLGASETAITLNGPLFKGKSEESKTGIIASVRRSYLQFLFELIGLPIRPDYWDYQYKIDHKINDYNYIYLLGVGSIDDFYLDGSGEINDNVRAALEQSPYINQRTNTIGLTWKNILKNGKGFMETTVSNNMLKNDFTRYQDNVKKQGILFSNNSSEIETQARYTFTYFNKNWKLNWGLNGKQVNYKNTTQTSSGLDNYLTDISFFKYGLFFNATRSFFKDRFDVSIGFRIDDDNYTLGKRDLLNLSPRLALAYLLSEKWKINATVGRYYKIPPYTVLGYQRNGAFLNKNSKYIQSDHYVIGLERFLGPSSSVSLEGFYKMYNNYPISLLDSVSLANKGADFEVLGNENIQSDGKGRAYGLEFFFQQKLSKRFYGVLSYTFFYSEFTGFNTNQYTPSLWDSRHLMALTGGYKLKRNWEISGRYRFAGETPYVPTDISESTISYPKIVLDYNRLGEERLGTFNQFDLRVDKKWNLKKASLNLYIEVQNLLSQSSPAPSNYVLGRNDDGTIADPRNLIEVSSNNNTPIPTIGIVIDI